jgi:hypothetical protein
MILKNNIHFSFLIMYTMHSAVTSFSRTRMFGITSSTFPGNRSNNTLVHSKIDTLSNG